MWRPARAQGLTLEGRKCLGFDLNANLGAVKYEDFCIVEGCSGLGSALESLKRAGPTGRRVRGRSPRPHETQFLTKSMSFYAVLGQGLGRGRAEGD